MDRAEAKIVALLASLEHPEKAQIRAAVRALIDLAAWVPDVREKLQASLEDSERKNGWAVAYVLGHLPQPPGSAIRALLDALAHNDPDIRWAVALLLVRLAGRDENVTNSLVQLCGSGSVNQRRMATYCIRDLELTDGNSMAALVAAAQDLDPTVRVAAVTTLRKRPDNGAAVRALLLNRFLNDEDGRVRNAAAIALAQLGESDKTFVQALEQSTTSGDARTRKAALAALDLLQIKRPAPNGS
jgi:HEAT repeat protein